MLVKLQVVTDAGQTNSATESTPVSASAAATPLSQLFSSIDTSDSGTISESELETYIEGIGGSQSEADALYNGLTDNGAQSLTLSQLTSDVQSAGPYMHHHGGMPMGASGQSLPSGLAPSGAAPESPSSLLQTMLSSLTASVPSANATGSGTQSNISEAAAGVRAARFSDKILGLLVSMQSQTASSASSQSGTSTAVSASTAATPLSQLFSAIDTNGSASISKTQLESYIEGLGGTHAEADALYNGLTSNGTQSLTLAQLGSDLQGAMPQGDHHHHHHHFDAAGATGNNLGSGTGSTTTSSAVLSALNLLESIPGGTSSANAA